MVIDHLDAVSKCHSTLTGFMTSTETGKPLRRIPSFVRREGRMTAGQQRALQEFWPRFGVDSTVPVDPAVVFGRVAPLTLEIGFGNGDTLLAMAKEYPDCDYLGIEVHRPGIGRLLHELEKQQLGNVRVMCGDAVDILHDLLPVQSLQRILLLFPDPWHKQRHHKRRIVQPDFIDLLAEKLHRGGILHMATDWGDYARHMLGVMRDNAAFRNCAGAGNFAQRPAYRPVTRFERRGQRLGHAVHDLLFERVG
jgi:tRNA (guanine-N7-)-methyltransferase